MGSLTKKTKVAEVETSSPSLSYQGQVEPLHPSVVTVQSLPAAFLLTLQAGPPAELYIQAGPGHGRAAGDPALECCLRGLGRRPGQHRGWDGPSGCPTQGRGLDFVSPRGPGEVALGKAGIYERAVSQQQGSESLGPEG